MVLQDNYWFDIVPSHEDPQILSIAGKWLVFGSTTDLHSVVKKVDALVESGSLPAAKIARKISGFDPFPDSPCVLCAFTSDSPAEKERVKLLLKQALNLEATVWKSDEQTRRDWDKDGWLAIRAEINSIQRALASSVSAPEFKSAHKRIAVLSDRLKKQLKDHPTQMTEAQLSGLQSVVSKLEAGVASRSAESAIQEQMRGLEAKVEEVLKRLQKVSAENVESRDETFIFVIMPFSEPHIDTFDAIERAILRVQRDLKVRRVDQQPGAIAITDEIHRSIRKAGLVICDLSDERPNVYYELGFAKGIGQRLICIAAEGTRIHFDAYGLKVLFFRTHRELEQKLASEVEQLLNVTAAKSDRA